ncbi:MAG: GNAT family N-acetyltransferase [Bosea sp. (in: a-proteobacteria)]
MDETITLRPGLEADMPALLDLWVEAWAKAMPEIDFASRRDWLRERQASMVAEGAVITMAEHGSVAVGFTLVNPATAYLDQIAVAPAYWSKGIARQLLDHARQLCPDALGLHVNQQNSRAIHFYEREGFRRTGEGINPRSGLPIYFYQWTPSGAGEPSSPN